MAISYTQFITLRSKGGTAFSTVCLYVSGCVSVCLFVVKVITPEPF